MKFIFELTEQDYLDFNMFTVKNYKFYKTKIKLFRVIFTIVPIGTGLVCWLFDGIKRSRADFMVGLFVAMTLLSILFWLVFPKFFDILMLRNAKKILFKEGKNNILGERTLFFEEDKIQTLTEYEESSIHYGAITQIKQSEKAIYLYTAPAMAMILPIRVFADEVEKQEFINFINTRLR